MKNFKPTKAKFHIGIMAGGRVYSSVDEKQGFTLEMWPMGLFVKGHGAHDKVSHVVTYNNVVGFDVEAVAEAAQAPPPAKAPLAAAPKALKAAK